MARTDPSYLYHIASLYYEYGLSQQEISEKEQLSRPHVSRLLTQAKQLGIVRIQLVKPTGSYTDDLADQLCRKLRLKAVHVVPTLPNNGMYTEQQLLDDFCQRSASTVAKLIEHDRVVGLGWGRTIFGIARNLPSAPVSAGCTFVPLAGSNSGIQGQEFQVSAVTLRFSDQLRGQAFFLNMSRLAENEAERTPEEVACYKQLQILWNTMSTAVFSVGNAANTIFSTGNSNIAGDILLQNYTTDGKVTRSPMSMDMICINVERLKSVPQTILVAASPDKVRAISYAAQLGFCNTLVTDVHTAKLLLDYDP